jgi:hypothetical protein
MPDKVKTAIEQDIEQNDIQIIEKDTSSDLIKAMQILHSTENLESNTILSNQQVNALSLMNWASQVYGIEFFKYYVALFPKYRISGDDGRGRKELIQIAEAIRREKVEDQSRLMELIGRK